MDLIKLTMRLPCCSCLLFCVFLVACRPGTGHLSWESSLIKVEEVSSLKEEALSLEEWHTIPSFGVMPESVVIDSFFVSFNNGSGSKHFAQVASVNTGMDCGGYVYRGRGPEDLVSCYPKPYMAKGSSDQDECLLWDYSTRRLFLWDVTASVQSHRTVFSKVLDLRSSFSDNASGLMSFSLLKDGRLLLLDSGMNPSSEEMTASPAVLSYDPEKSAVEPLPLFRVIDTRRFSEDFATRKGVFSSVACFSDKHEKLFLAMWYFPQIMIIDKDLQARAMYLHGENESDWKKQFCCFRSVTCSDDRVYALFSGSSRSETSVGARKLFVFDWDGNLLQKYALSEAAYSITYDKKGGRLFFIDPISDKIWYKSMP